MWFSRTFSGFVRALDFLTFNVPITTRRKPVTVRSRGYREGCERFPREEKYEEWSSPAMRPTEQHGESGTMKVRSNTARSSTSCLCISAWIYASAEKRIGVLFIPVYINACAYEIVRSSRMIKKKKIIRLCLDRCDSMHLGQLKANIGTLSRVLLFQYWR